MCRYWLERKKPGGVGLPYGCHAKPKLKSAQELYEVLLFLRRQLCAINQVEEFHGVFQG
jgi:hypothetical protein